jgi:hypothetical protein
MPILSKGYTFTSTEQVTSTKLGNLVDNATFASGAVDDSTTQLSSGAIIVKNGGITPTKLSNGAPTWDTSNNLTVNGTITSGGTISTSGDLAVNGTAAINGTSTFTGNATFAGQIIASGTGTSRTVQLRTASATPNAISFGWDNGDLLVTVDGTTYSVTLTPV